MAPGENHGMNGFAFKSYAICISVYLICYMTIFEDNLLYNDKFIYPFFHNLTYLFVMLSCALFIDALWSPAGKVQTSWLSFVMSNCELLFSHWYPGSGVVLDCIDS